MGPSILGTPPPPKRGKAWVSSCRYGPRTTSPYEKRRPTRAPFLVWDYVLLVDDDDVRTESQKEWANWAAHGYRKLYQPRSLLWFGGIFCTLLVAGLLVIFIGHFP
jgi:hypothetical protein